MADYLPPELSGQTWSIFGRRLDAQYGVPKNVISGPARLKLQFLQRSMDNIEKIMDRINIRPEELAGLRRKFNALANEYNGVYADEIARIEDVARQMPMSREVGDAVTKGILRRNTVIERLLRATKYIPKGLVGAMVPPVFGPGGLPSTVEDLRNMKNELMFRPEHGGT